MNFLETVIKYKKSSLIEAKKNVPFKILFAQLEEIKLQFGSFGKSLSKEGVRIIAEMKKASPLAGILCSNYVPAKIAREYSSCGAAAISVLTEEKYFLGSLDDIKIAKQNSSVPILRKDFIVDEYQLVEAKLAGADTVLLIVAALNKSEILNLISFASKISLECLVEVHTIPELELACECGANIIGINNRSLETLKVDLNTGFKMLSVMPKNKITVIESGIKTFDEINSFISAGVNAFLIGETIIKSQNPCNKLKELLGEKVA
ncbi:MAG: indole-3-glycerol phosphate synthase TrpC [Endomicrobiales bacterium]|nr:indole-3-glycerol phosphate synthase TrpC [Endomicrobiales bacterium]